MNRLKGLCFILFFPLLTTVYAAPVFTISPNESQVYLRSDGMAVVQWTVTNDARSATNITITANWGGSNATLQNNTCTATLASGSSCTFDTLIQGRLEGASFQLSPKVCGFLDELCSVPQTFLPVTVVPVQSPAYAYIGIHSNDNTIATENELLPIAVPSETIGTAADNFSFNNLNGVTLSLDGSKIFSANIGVVSTSNTGSSGLSIPLPLTLKISARPRDLNSAPQLLGALTLPIISSSFHNVRIPGPKGGVSPTYLAVTPDGKTVYLDGYNTVYVINVEDPTNPILESTLSGVDNAYGIVVDPSGSKVYVARQDGIDVIATATNTIESTIDLPGNNYGIAITPDGTALYVTHQDSTVSVIDTQLPNAITTLNIDTPSSDGVAISPDGTKAYVTDNQSNQLFVIDTSHISDPPTIIAVGAVDGGTAGIAIAPDGTKAFVITTDMDHPLAVIDLTNTSLITYPSLNISEINTNQLGNFVG